MRYQEKAIYCGEQYLEVDIYPTSFISSRASKDRKRRKVTDPIQKNLNSKNARRWFSQKLNTNFNKDDYHVTLTYWDEMLPDSFEEAEKNKNNFIRRVNALSNKKKYGNVRYMAVVEQSSTGRWHHHIVISTKLSRDEVESMWKRGRGKNSVKLGRTKCEYLQPDEYGLSALANYITKETRKGKKRWSQSRGLKQPLMQKKKKYTRSHIAKLHREGTIFEKEYWKERYKDYYFTEIEVEFNDVLGMPYYYVKMRK